MLRRTTVQLWAPRAQQTHLYVFLRYLKPTLIVGTAVYCLSTIAERSRQRKMKESNLCQVVPTGGGATTSPPIHATSKDEIPCSTNNSCAIEGVTFRGKPYTVEGLRAAREAAHH